MFWGFLWVTGSNLDPLSNQTEGFHWLKRWWTKIVVILGQISFIEMETCGVHWTQSNVRWLYDLWCCDVCGLFILCLLLIHDLSRFNDWSTLMRTTVRHKMLPVRLINCVCTLEGVTLIKGFIIWEHHREFHFICPKGSKYCSSAMHNYTSIDW